MRASTPTDRSAARRLLRALSVDTVRELRPPKDEYVFCAVIPEGATEPVAWGWWNVTTGWLATVADKDRERAHAALKL